MLDGLPLADHQSEFEYDRRQADIKLRLRSERYVPDTVGLAVEKASHGSLINIAAEVCLRSILSVGAAQAWEFANAPTDAERKAGYFAANKIIKPIEEAALQAWAAHEQLMLDDKEFERRWVEGGEQEGTEHQVYFDPSTQRWFKRNNLCNHGHWLEYFQRLQLHNVLFPEAPVQLEGFVIHHREFQPVVSQPDVQADSEAPWDEQTAREATRAFLKEAGFEPIDNPARKDDYYSPSLGVEINDMHNENVVKTKAGVAAFDPVPRLDWANKFQRVKARLGI